MTIWAYLNTDGSVDMTRGLHDDMNGAALSLAAWPQGMTLLTAAQVQAIHAAQQAAAQSTQAALPNPAQFFQSCKTALGGPTGILSFSAQVQSAIALTFSAVQLQDWPDVQAYITAMQIPLGPAYTAIKTDAATYNIPVTLP